MFKRNYQATFSKVTASEDTYRRIMNMTNTKKHQRSRSFVSKVLMAAIVATMLAATASAASFGWFTRFFGGPENLNQDQIQYLEENTQMPPVSSNNEENATREDGCAISVDSVLTDGASAFIALSVTMPEEMESPGEGWIMEDGPHFLDIWLCPADQQKPAMEELTRWTCGSKAFDDGDGQDNTCKLILCMTRDGTEALSGLGKEWILHIGGLEVTWRHAEKENLITSEYAGQEYIIDGDEVNQFLRFETLTEEVWEFALPLGPGGNDEVEFVLRPVSLSGYRPAMLNEILEDSNDDRIGPFEVQLVSLRISPLSYYLQYAAEDIYNAQTVDVGAHTLVMKDGTKIELFQHNGRHTFAQPIIMSEIDHVLLSNGVMLSMAE